MNPPSEDIKDMLEAESSLDLEFADNLFFGKEPAEPNNTVTIFDTPGSAPQLTLDRSEIYEFPSIQIRVRNKDYGTGWDILNDIKNILHGIGHETFNGAIYELIKCSIDVALLDYDKNNRPRFVATFDIERKPE